MTDPLQLPRGLQTKIDRAVDNPLFSYGGFGKGLHDGVRKAGQSRTLWKPGGATINVVVAASAAVEATALTDPTGQDRRLTRPIEWRGLLGIDSGGDDITKFLEARNIKVSAVYRGEGARALVTVDDKGERTIEPSIPATGKLQLDDIDSWKFDNVAGCRLDGRDGKLDRFPDVVFGVAQRLHEQGALVSLSSEGANQMDQHGPKGFFGTIARVRPDICYFSREEAEALGISQDRPLHPVLKSVSLVVVHRSSEPTLVMTSDGQSAHIPVPAVPQHKIRDLLGCGDAMEAVSDLALLAGWAPERAFAFGNIAGSRVAQTVGAQLPKNTKLKENAVSLAPGIAC